MYKLEYFFAKLIYKIQRPALKDCNLSSRCKVLPMCNLIRVSIGRYSYVGKGNTMQDVEIGSFCSIGSFVSAGGGIHPIGLPSTSPVFYDEGNIFTDRFLLANVEKRDSSKTIVGNDVWIGDFSYIKAGVKVGDGVIIGAHSVVTHDIPPYAIVAGVPAKVIRYRFSSLVIEKLLDLKWWLWDDAKIEKYKQIIASETEILNL